MLCSYLGSLFIKDDFNLTGLNSLVPYYDYALDMVLDVEMPMEDQLTEVSTYSFFITTVWFTAIFLYRSNKK